MKNKPTVTIGIPAHNEEANIGYLLKSILKQKGNFVIEKIYVLCDGCTDATVEKVGEIAKKHSIITVLNDGKRKGKTGRLNQLYRLNKSKFVFNFDGDIILKSDRVVELMVSAFKTKNVVLVSGNNQPVKAETLVERIYNAGFKTWYEIRRDYLSGNNVRNIHGCAVALRGSFAKTFEYPLTILSGDQGFVFMAAKVQKKSFRFEKNAVVLFRSVNNLRDFFLQATRNLDIKDNVAKSFGDQVYGEYVIPIKFKLKGIVKTLFSDPIFTTLALILRLSLNVFPRKQLEVENGSGWEMVKSTKKAICI
ncbi:glycosyltransferase family 2 protein [Patescibacteria group bacterium]|nr:glycosyltransferase family 2 protein [Patescibacteria group bacterium]